MSFPKLALWILLLQTLPRAASDSASDSRILREIADSLHVGVEANITRREAGRVTFLSIYYRQQRGAVPAALGGLDSLRSIFMGITGVTSLPKEIGRLQRLDTINIGSSAIGPTLPDEIGDLSGLRILIVQSCRLESLPTSLMKLQKLEFVDFSGNAICQVEDSLRQWILSKWPNALNNQRTANCLPTGMERRSSPPGKGPHRLLSIPGAPDVTPAEGLEAEDIRYYTPLGRRPEPAEGPPMPATKPIK